jgi:hypothetical protein
MHASDPARIMILDTLLYEFRMKKTLEAAMLYVMR